MTVTLPGHEPAARSAEAGGWPTLIFFAGAAVVLLPFVLFHHLAMVDYANHLARLYILSAPGDDVLRQMYATSWAPIPNLGIDLLYAGVHGWCSPELTIKLAVVLSTALILGSVYIIQKTIFGRVSYSIAIAPLFVHGLVIYMGYLNYLMGTALGFAGFALFFVAGRRLTAPLVALLGGLGALIYLCHIAAFAGYVLLLGTLIIYPAVGSFRRASIRGLIVPVLGTGLIAAPAALLYVISEKPAAADGFVYSISKLRSVIAPTLVSAGFADTALLIGVVGLLFAMHRCRALSFWRAGRPALIALLLVILALPNRVDKAVDVDSRLVIFPIFLSLAFLELRPPTRRARAVIAATIIALTAVRFWDVLAIGHEYEREVAEFRSASGYLRPGEKVLIAEDTRTTGDCAQAPTDLSSRLLFSHFGSYLTIDRKVFVPLTFADRGMQPIRPIGQYARVSTRPSSPPPLYLLKYATDPDKRAALLRALADAHAGNYFVDWREKFDDVVVLHHGCASNPFPGELAAMSGGRFFTMYRVLPE